MVSPAKILNPATVDRFRQQMEDGAAGEHFYTTLLGLRTHDTLELHGKLEEGLSYRALEELRRVLDVPTTRVADLLRVPPRTLARRKDAKRLQPDESDRLLRLSRIVGLALRLFEGDLAATRAWLFAPHPALSDESPADFAATAIGAREVENLIGRIEHGIPL